VSQVTESGTFALCLHSSKDHSESWQCLETQSWRTSLPKRAASALSYARNHFTRDLLA